MDDAHILATIIRNLRPRAAPDEFGLTEISLGDLPVTAINYFFQNALALIEDTARAQELVH